MTAATARAVTTRITKVKVGDRILVQQGPDSLPSVVRRATRAHPDPIVATVTKSGLADLYGGTSVRLVTTAGSLTLSRGLSVLVLPPPEGEEADQRLRHGVQLLRHGAALVAPEVPLLPVDHSVRLALTATLASIERLVTEFEDTYDLPVGGSL